MRYQIRYYYPAPATASTSSLSRLRPTSAATRGLAGVDRDPDLDDIEFVDGPSLRQPQCWRISDEAQEQMSVVESTRNERNGWRGDEVGGYLVARQDAPWDIRKAPPAYDEFDARPGTCVITTDFLQYAVRDPFRIVGGWHTHSSRHIHCDPGLEPSNADLRWWARHCAELGGRPFLGLIVGRSIEGPLMFRGWAAAEQGGQRPYRIERARVLQAGFEL